MHLENDLSLLRQIRKSLISLQQLRDSKLFMARKITNFIQLNN